MAELARDPVVVNVEVRLVTGIVLGNVGLPVFPRFVAIFVGRVGYRDRGCYHSAAEQRRRDDQDRKQAALTPISAIFTLVSGKSVVRVGDCARHYRRTAPEAAEKPPAQGAGAIPNCGTVYKEV